eukprot:7354602-Lingulodinium_polyedra.AAC.1
MRGFGATSPAASLSRSLTRSTSAEFVQPGAATRRRENVQLGASNSSGNGTPSTTTRARGSEPRTC